MGLLTTDPVLIEAASGLQASHGIRCPVASRIADLPRACHLILVDAQTVAAESSLADGFIVLRGPPVKGALVALPTLYGTRTEFAVLAACARALLHHDMPVVARMASSFPGGELGARQYLHQVVARAGASFDQMLQAAETGDFERVRRLSWELAPHIGILGMAALRNVMREIEAAAYHHEPAVAALIAVARHRWRRISPTLMQALDVAAAHPGQLLRAA